VDTCLKTDLLTPFLNFNSQNKPLSQLLCWIASTIDSTADGINSAGFLIIVIVMIQFMAKIKLMQTVSLFIAVARKTIHKPNLGSKTSHRNLFEEKGIFENISKLQLLKIYWQSSNCN